MGRGGSIYDIEWKYFTFPSFILLHFISLKYVAWWILCQKTYHIIQTEYIVDIVYCTIVRQLDILCWWIFRYFKSYDGNNFCLINITEIWKYKKCFLSELNYLLSLTRLRYLPRLSGDIQRQAKDCFLPDLSVSCSIIVSDGLLMVKSNPRQVKINLSTEKLQETMLSPTLIIWTQ